MSNPAIEIKTEKLVPVYCILTSFEGNPRPSPLEWKLPCKQLKPEYYIIIQSSQHLS